MLEQKLYPRLATKMLPQGIGLDEEIFDIQL